MARVQAKSVLPPGSGLEIVKVEFVRGDTFEFEVKSDLAQSDRAEISIHTEGSLETRRLTGAVQLTGVLARNAGDVSYETYPPCVFAAGKFRVTALSDRAVYYCIHKSNNNRIDAETIRLNPGGSYTVLKGDRAFIASGSCQHGQAPVLIEAATKDAVINATSPLLGVRIR